MIKYYFCCFCLIMLLIFSNKYLNFLYGGNNLKKINNNLCISTNLKLVKNACEFIGLIDFATKEQIMDFLKHNFMIKNNFQDNLIYINYALRIPLKMVISNKFYVEQLDKLLLNLDKRFYNIVLFDLYHLFSHYSSESNKLLWIEILNDFKIKYQNNTNFEKNIEKFLELSIDPNSNILFIKLYNMTKNDNDWIEFQKYAENNKNIFKNSLNDFYLKHTNKNIDKNLNLKTHENQEIEINQIQQQFKQIINKENTNINNSLTQFNQNNNISDILIKVLINLSKKNKLYSKICNNILDDLSKKIYFYNKICKYKKDSKRTCPLNIKIANKKINCNNKIQRNIENLNSDGCKKCEVQINKCKINLKCLDDYYDNTDETVKDILIDSKNEISQNGCKINVESSNLDKIQLNLNKNKLFENYDNSFLSQSKQCELKSSLKTYQNNINSIIKFKKMYKFNNELLTYIYFSYDDIESLNLNYLTDKYPMIKSNIGYTGFFKKDSSNNIDIFKYKYDKNEHMKCMNKNNCSQIINKFDNLFDTNLFETKFDKSSIAFGNSYTNIQNEMYLDIYIGKGGFGGGKLDRTSSNLSDYTCAGSGGNTIINFKLDSRFYSWDDKIIAYGGKYNRTSNNKFTKTSSLSNRLELNYFNKGNQHLYYNKNHISGGGGGGCFRQLQIIARNYVDPFQSDKGNKYNNINLNTFTHTQEPKIYLSNDVNGKFKIINYFEKSNISGANSGIPDDNDLNLYNGDHASFYGCGGGGGAKKSDLDRHDSYFGSGGSGKLGAVVIFNKNFEVLWNSTDNTSNLNNTDSYHIKIYLKDYDDKLKLGEIFYIISIGGGGGGMSGLVSGSGGNGGNMVISKHLYEIPFSTVSRTDIADLTLTRNKNFQIMRNNWISKENDYYDNSILPNIKKTLLNKYINDCKESLCNVSKINKPVYTLSSNSLWESQTNQNINLKNFININKKTYFGFLYDTSLLYKTINNNTNNIYKIYSINNEGVINNHIYNIRFIKNGIFDCNIELFDLNNTLIDYKTKVYFLYNPNTKSINIYIHDLNNSSSNLYWKNDNLLKNKTFSMNKNSVRFLHDNNNNSFNLRLYKSNNNITEKLWILFNSIKIDTVNDSPTNTRFECRTTINPYYINENFIYFVTIKPKKETGNSLYDSIKCVNERYNTKINSIIDKINNLYKILSTDSNNKLHNIKKYFSYFEELKNEISNEINNLNKKNTILEEDNILETQIIDSEESILVKQLSSKYTLNHINTLSNIMDKLIIIKNNLESYSSTVIDINSIELPSNLNNNIYNQDEYFCDIQLPIKLMNPTKIINTNIFTYTAHIYGDIKNNILSNTELKFTELIKNTIKNNYDVNYINKDDILQINSIYLSTNKPYLNINDEITLINDAIYVISITDIFENLTTKNNYENFRDKISILNNLYPAGGESTYYFIYSNLPDMEITINKTYNVEHYNNPDNKINIKIIDILIPYYVIIINSNQSNLFETTNIYKFDETKRINCDNYNDVYNIRDKPITTSSPANDDKQVCCNNINLKNPSLCSQNNKSLCWFNNEQCKRNYIRINYIKDNKYYFSTNNINDFNGNEKINVDIIRNSTPFKSNILIFINKENDDNITNIIDENSRKTFYLIGSDNIASGTYNNEYKLNIVSPKLKLFNNYINISDSYGKIQNQLKYLNNAINSYKMTTNSLNINFTNRINIKKLTLYYLSNKDAKITINLNNNLALVKSIDTTLLNTYRIEKKYSIDIDLPNSDSFNKISIYQSNETNSTLYIRNFAILGQLNNIPKHLFQGYFTINDNQIKLKLNDYIVFKEHII